MFALRIGLLAVDGITLAEVTPVRERLEALGAQVTLVVPGGGSILPITGRYIPAAGGQGVRRAISQVSPSDYDFMLIPDGIAAAQLTHYGEVMDFVRGQSSEESTQPLPIFLISYMLHLLSRNVNLASLVRNREGVLSGSGRG